MASSVAKRTPRVQSRADISILQPATTMVNATAAADATSAASSSSSSSSSSTSGAEVGTVTKTKSSNPADSCMWYGGDECGTPRSCYDCLNVAIESDSVRFHAFNGDG